MNSIRLTIFNRLTGKFMQYRIKNLLTTEEGVELEFPIEYYSITLIL